MTTLRSRCARALTLFLTGALLVVSGGNLLICIEADGRILTLEEYLARSQAEHRAAVERLEAAGGVVTAEPDPAGAPAETSAGSPVRRTVVPEWADLETDPTAALMAWEEHAQQHALGAKHAADDGISKQA